MVLDFEEIKSVVIIKHQNLFHSTLNQNIFVNFHFLFFIFFVVLVFIYKLDSAKYGVYSRHKIIGDVIANWI